MSVLGGAARVVGLCNVAQKLDHDVLLDAISTLLFSQWFWIVQGLIVSSAAASGWLLARASADSHEAPQLPRYSSSTQNYSTFASSTGDQVNDTAQVIALQEQVRAGKDEISALEAKVVTLATALMRAETETAQMAVLRAEGRDSDATIFSLDTKLNALRAQASTREQIISPTEARVTQLSAALERAEANATRLSALWTEARGSDAIIFSLDSKLEALREKARNKEETISSLESRIVSLSTALAKAEQGPQSRSPVSLSSSPCERCTPPTHISTGKARGKWLRRQAETLNDEAGKILFDAHNPELAGSRARLRNEMRIDLHLQYRSAAVDYAKNYAASARDQGLDKIIFIVGKGLHSEDNIPKLRPLVLDTLKSMGLEVRSPQNNPGEIVVKLQKTAD